MDQKVLLKAARTRPLEGPVQEEVHRECRRQQTYNRSLWYDLLGAEITRQYLGISLAEDTYRSTVSAAPADRALVPLSRRD